MIFFFQAEDGIRDLTVTGVQTCALPICSGDLPGISARTRLGGVAETPGPDPSLQAAWHQYRGWLKARKCRCFFGLAHLRVHRLWSVTRAAVSPWRGRPHDVELCIHIVHVPTSRLGADFEVTVGLVGVRRDEEEARPTRREPAGEELGCARPTLERLAQQDRQPTAGWGARRGAAAQHPDDGAPAPRRPQEKRDGGNAPGKEGSTH